jgi:hypothetical protein
MRNTKRLVHMLAAVCLCGAMVASSASASPTFLAHSAGGLLLATAGTTQIFKTAAVYRFEILTTGGCRACNITGFTHLSRSGL